jgi:hypothetical protein
MRWNCPHCATLVNLDIDLDRTPKAYVRCGKCMGIALIQKNAGENQAAPPPSERDLSKSFIDARNSLQAEEANTRKAQLALAENYLSSNPEENQQQAAYSETTMEMNGGATFPVREFHAKTSLPRPPAFLLSASTAGQNQAAPTLYGTFHMDPEENQTLARLRSIVILAIASAALIGGIYLFIQSQKVMQESHLKVRQIEEKITQAQSTTQAIDSAPIQADAIQLESAASIPQKRVTPRPKQPEIPPLKPQIRVIVPQAILRSAPSTEAIAIDRLKQNETFTIQSFRGNWIQVEGRKQGWLRNDLVTMVEAP